MKKFYKIALFLVLSFLLINTNVNAASNGTITLPEWGNYVFGFDGGPHFGFDKIKQGKYVNIDSYYISTNIPSDSKNFYINTFWGKYTDKPYTISFFLIDTWTHKNPLTNITANGVPCSVDQTLDYGYNMTCNGVVPTKEGNNSRIEIRFVFNNSIGATGTVNLGISKFNTYLLDPATAIQDANDKLIDNQNKNHQETIDTITDSSVDGDNISSLGGTVLPTNGALSSILNMPITFFNTLLNNLDPDTCLSSTIKLPFVDYEFTYPCARNLLNDLGALDFYELIGTLVGGLAIFKYLIYMGKEMKKMQDLESSGAEFGGL